MKKLALRALNVLIAALIILESLTPLGVFNNASASPSATFTVNSSADPGDGACDATECTLREAINAANARSGKDTIVFDMPYLDVPIPVISPKTPLPAITDPIIIDGSTQPLFEFVFLHGGGAGAGAYGLRITAGGSTIKDLDIYDFAGPGILLESNGNNVIEDNSIHDNGGAGVAVLSGTGHYIHGNSMWDNVGLGIDLGNDGMTPNDQDDPDSGPNRLQNYPAVTAINKSGGKTAVWGALQSTPNTRFTIEFFSNETCDELGFGEGQVSLGTVMATTDDEGNVTFTFNYAGTARNITLSATDPYSDTSEFSRCMPNLIVNSTADLPDKVQGDTECDTGNTLMTGEPECTLRAAIQEANATAGRDSITFNIPSYNFIPTIAPVTPLPQIVNPVDMDATTQPSGGRVELSGVYAGGAANGLDITAGDSSVKGLAIYKFGGTAISLGTGGNNTIANNIIGTNAGGFAPNLGNKIGISINDVGNNIIQGNVISGNLESGIVMAGAGAQSNLAQSNILVSNHLNLSVTGSSNRIYNNVFKKRAPADSNASFASGLANTLNQAKTRGTNIVSGPFLGGNYWSDYVGSDADKDGLGDTPHRLDASNVDNLPLIGNPDLAVVPFTLNHDAITYSGGKYIMPLNITIQNIGTGDASNILVRFTDNGGLNTTQTIPQLQVDASAQLHLDWDITPILKPVNGKGAIQLTVVADPNNAILESDKTNNSRNPSLLANVRPMVLQVEPEYFPGWFMAGVSVQNLFKAKIDWNGYMAGMGEDQAKQVYFELEGLQAVELANNQTIVMHTFDMGDNMHEGKNTLRIYAQNVALFMSDKDITQIHQTAVPVWLVFVPATQSTFDIERIIRPGPDLVLYRSQFKFPGEVVKAAVAAGAQAGPASGRFGPTIPAWELKLEEVSDGRGRAIGYAGITAETKGKSFEGSFGGGIDALTKVDAQDKVRVVELWALIRGSGKFKTPRWRLPQAPVVYVQIAGGLDLEGRLGAEEVRATQQLKFKPNVLIRLEPMLEAAVGAGEKGLAWVEAVFGAKVRGEYQFFDSPFARSVLIRAYVRVGAGVLWFEKVQTWTWTWVLVGAQGQEQELWLVGQPELVDAGEWHPIPRDWVNYYDAAPGSNPFAPAGSGSALVEAYPYADPAAAYLGNGRTLAVWVHDDPAKPQHQGLELYSAVWDGLNWSAPLSLTNDLVMDTQPALIATPGGALAVWTRLHDAITGTVPLSPTEIYDEMEIAYATFDSTGNAWSAPQLLTNNGVMDMLPNARSSLTQTMVLWLQDPDNNFPTYPTDVTPLGEDVYYATRAGTNWSISPTVALTNVATSEQPQFVYNGQQAILAWSQDNDGNPTTVTDTEILYSTWDVTTTAWTGRQALTNNALADLSPRLIYDGAGAAHLFWTQEVADPDNADDALSRLYHATFNGGAWSSPSLIFEEYGIEGLQVISDTHGNLIAVWRSVSDQLCDLYSSVYDAQNNTWSRPALLTRDRDMEWAYDVVYDAAQDQIFLVHLKRQINSETVPVEFPAGTLRLDVLPPSPAQASEIVSITLPTFGQSSITVLTHTLAPDLAITPTDIVLSPTNPLPGSAALISATVRNAGDLTAHPVRVAFYDGDPSAGGALIGAMQSLASSLAGGLTATLAVSWSVPITPMAHSLYVKADPLNEIIESDESNNQAARIAVLPDLTVDYAYATYGASRGITLSAVISNAGGCPAANVPIEFRQESVTGTLLGQALSVTLAAGQSQEISVYWDISATIPASHTVWVLVDPTNTITEADEMNNTGLVWADLLPDLTLDAEDIEGSGPVTITVRNNGWVTATDVTVALYRDVLTSTPLYSGTLATIPPSGTGTLSATIAATSGYTLFVEIDPSDAIAEMDESNNLAMTEFALPSWSTVYLPLIVRGN